MSTHEAEADPPDYGRRGRLGIATPQANPTVEPEAHALAPEGVALHTVRLVSPARDPKERLIAYLRELETTLERFDTLKLDALGFFCTASSYYVPQEEARAILQRAEDRFGYPVLTAAAAIEDTLKELGVERLMLVSPYPDALTQAAASHWQGRGLNVVDIQRLTLPSEDTRGIYGLTSRRAEELLRAADFEQVDAVLISGTGLPSLRLLRDQTGGPPLISSNYCLMMALLRRIGAVEEGMSADRLLAEIDSWLIGLSAMIR